MPVSTPEDVLLIHSATHPVGGTAGYRVRAMVTEDVPGIVAWHLEAFPAGFYAQLGGGFMAAWVREHRWSPASIALVILDPEDGIVGYLLGTTDDRRYRSRNRGSARRLLLRGGVALLARPRLWLDFARRRARPYAVSLARRILPAARTVGDAPTVDGELLYICVEAGHRRRGAGAVLLEAYTRACRLHGTQRLHLVTEQDNVGAHRFYLLHAWQVGPEPTRSLDGRALLRMERSL